MSARNYAPILKSELAVHACTEKSLGPFRDVVTSDKRDYPDAKFGPHSGHIRAAVAYTERAKVAFPPETHGGRMP